MFPQIRIADGFRLQSAEQLVVIGCAIIERLTGNPALQHRDCRRYMGAHVVQCQLSGNRLPAF